MSEVIELTDHPKYRAFLSDLNKSISDARTKFIESLTLAQYQKFKKEFRYNRLTLDINKITLNKYKQSLYNDWCCVVQKWNHIHENSSIENADGELMVGQMNNQLIDAAKNGDLSKVKRLLDAGANVHADDGEALIWASINGHTEIVKLLLDHGADVHANDDRALKRASENGHTETVKLLLDHGADVHAYDDSALRWASHNGHTETVKLLLEHGADVHARDDEPMLWASIYRHTETVKLLKSWGKDDWRKIIR